MSLLRVDCRDTERENDSAARALPSHGDRPADQVTPRNSRSSSSSTISSSPPASFTGPKWPIVTQVSTPRTATRRSSSRLGARAARSGRRTRAAAARSRRRREAAPAPPRRRERRRHPKDRVPSRACRAAAASPDRRRSPPRSGRRRPRAPRRRGWGSARSVAAPGTTSLVPWNTVHSSPPSTNNGTRAAWRAPSVAKPIGGGVASRSRISTIQLALRHSSASHTLPASVLAPATPST